MSNATTTISWTWKENYGPFATKEEALSKGIPAEFNEAVPIRQSSSGKWWRVWPSTSTLPPLEEEAASAQGPLRFRRLVLPQEGGGDDTDSLP